MIGSKSHVFFVFDDGTEIKIIEKTEKDKHKNDTFDIKEGARFAKIIFKDSKKEIPFDLTITGGTTTTMTTFKKFLHE